MTSRIELAMRQIHEREAQIAYHRAIATLPSDSPGWGNFEKEIKDYMDREIELLIEHPNGSDVLARSQGFIRAMQLFLNAPGLSRKEISTLEGEIRDLQVDIKSFSMDEAFGGDPGIDKILEKERSQ